MTATLPATLLPFFLTALPFLGDPDVPVGTVYQEFDRTKDTTILRVKLGEVFRGPDHNVELSLARGYLAENSRATESKSPFTLYFFSVSSDGLRYSKAHDITIITDKQRQTFRDAPGSESITYENDVKRGYALEHIHLDLTESQFKTLAGAKTIEIALAASELKLSRGQISAVADFARYDSDPSLKVPDLAKPERLTAKQQKVRELQKRRDAPKQQADGADDDRKKANLRAASKLALGRALERQNKIAAAIRFYREVVRDYPDTPSNGIAADRIKALAGK